MKRMLVPVFGMALITTPAFGHESEQHVMGTVTKVSGSSITVEMPAKTPTGAKTKTTVAIVPETKFIKNGLPVALKDLKVGDRVVIHAVKKGGQLEAHTVRIGASKDASQAH